MTRRSVRVLWLLNHTTLRSFEIGQFGALGITEIYCPKTFPYDEGNLSASVDETLDAALTLPAEDLKNLNEQNWYESPSEEAWRIANQYFDVAVIGFFPQQIVSCVRHFKGAIVLRVFGLAEGYSYTQILGEELGPTFLNKLRRLGGRFWFGAGYDHLKDVEGDLLKSRTCFLPVGLEGELRVNSWRGTDKRIFFVCPRIETSPYFKSIYRSFKADFSGLRYLIGGAQPIKVADPDVLGFVPREVHERNMQEMRVMFYHSKEPNHIHYHPFEAIRSGMPLVFMAGGMLDRFAGKNIPGRCSTIQEARRKIERILNDDWSLIDRIRSSQLCLLEPMKSENCAGVWRDGIHRILNSVPKTTDAINIKPRKHRIAVIVPTAYRGGSLRGAKLLAQAIELGARQGAEDIEVILGHLDDAACYPDEEFADLSFSIKRRPFRWRILSRDEAERAMAYAGLTYSLDSPTYQVPDDNINQFIDCDLWVVVSDRLEHPLLPIRPYVVMVYDYLQRYERFLTQASNRKFVEAAHRAQRVFVTTEFSRRDAIQFAGLSARKLVKLPMLAPEFSSALVSQYKDETRYFLWTTNLAVHKNHENAIKAIRLYYENYAGQLECRVTGVNTKNMMKGDLPHLKMLREIFAESTAVRNHLKVLGELPDQAYREQLAGSDFLWHAGRIDNGTFSVVEAAHLRVPALSSDYPAMREIDTQYGLNLIWMDPNDPEDMARQLKYMETNIQMLRAALPTSERLAGQSLTQLAGEYWEAVQDCL